MRGLHFQWDPPQGKLMRVVAGRAFLVAVDIRPGSPTLGRAVTLEASADDPVLVWAPASFARGFAALADGTEIEYFCTAAYNPASEAGHPLGRSRARHPVAGRGAAAVGQGRRGGHARGLASPARISRFRLPAEPAERGDGPARLGTFGWCPRGTPAVSIR